MAEGVNFGVFGDVKSIGDVDITEPKEDRLWLLYVTHYTDDEDDSRWLFIFDFVIDIKGQLKSVRGAYQYRGRTYEDLHNKDLLANLFSHLMVDAMIRLVRKLGHTIVLPEGGSQATFQRFVRSAMELGLN